MNIKRSNMASTLGEVYRGSSNSENMKYMGGGKMDGEERGYARGYAKGGKNPFYQNGGMTPGGSDVQKLLQMLANYDQNAPIGEFMQVLMEMGGQGDAQRISDQNREIQEGLASGDGAMAGSAMRNLPPRDVESLLMQLGQQGR
tara:strand:+ start:1518 stop:1949 length:432 start_codon:yes stop_codon:yes gene_type:complete